MAVLEITFRGSFDTKGRHEFKTIEHGHARAVRKAIGFLRGEVLETAIRQDARLHSAGRRPEQGFLEQDIRAMESLDKRPGEAVLEMEELSRGLAFDIDSVCPPGWVFVLTFFSVGERGAMSYISNGERSSMIAGLEEVVAKLKAGDMGTVGKPIPEEPVSQARTPPPDPAES